jgi:hypothetical protein
MASGSRRRDGTGGAIPSWKLTVSALPATRHAERPIFSRSRSVVANKPPTGLPRRGQGLGADLMDARRAVGIAFARRAITVV